MPAPVVGVVPPATVATGVAPLGGGVAVAASPQALRSIAPTTRAVAADIQY
jgi:hypothetical protein